MDCLVTGASGFIASELVSLLVRKNYRVSAATRDRMGSSKTIEKEIVVAEIDQTTLWKAILVDITTVIHLANRTHVINDKAKDPLAEYRKVNVAGTLTLAQQAVEAGVKRFIYLSSIKVNGERTTAQAFRYDDIPAPEDFYAISKWEAEQGLKELCAESAMELVIIRPPLVYGPGVKGNLKRLTKAVDIGIPLPLGGVENLRDLISLYNLVDLIETCITHPDASGETFLCSDGHPASTPELIAAIAKARNKKPRLFRLPSFISAKLMAAVIKRGGYERLYGDLRVDIEHTKKVLGWRPPVSFEDGILRAFAKDAEIKRLNAHG